MFETYFAYFYKHALKMRHPAELSWILVHPLVSILSVGILGLFLSLRGSPLNPIFFIVAGAVVWDFFGLSQRAVSYGLMFDIWDGCLKHNFVAKAKIKEFVIGNCLFGIVSSTVATILVAAIAYFAFGFNLLVAGIYLVIALFATFIFGTANGLVINSLALWRNYSWMTLVWIGTGVIMIFSGVYYPIDILPEPAKTISVIIPATHAIAAIRGATGISGVNVSQELITALIISTVYFIFSIYFFKKSIWKAQITGNLTH